MTDGPTPMTPSQTPSFLSSSLRVFDLSLGQMLWSRRTVFMGLVVGGPVVMALLVALVDALGAGGMRVNGVRLQGPAVFGMMIWVFYLRFSVPVLAVFYGTSLIADEVEDKTITYLFTRPIPRGAVLVGKYLAYLACTALVVLPSVMFVYFIVVPRGQSSVAWFAVLAMAGMLILNRVGAWYARYRAANAGRGMEALTAPLPRRRIVVALVVLTLLVFSKNIYPASISSYYTFFLIEKFGVSVQQSQMMLFLFLGAMALGTVLGGPIGDRFGSRTVIWFSILGVLPFTLALPYADLFWSGVLSFVIGVVMASAFPAIVVFAQELVPGRVGMIAGIFFGFAFGMGGIAAAVLGVLADINGIEWVYGVCSFLPAIGLLTVLLPSRAELRQAR